MPRRNKVAFLQFTVREKQKACVPEVPQGTPPVRFELLSLSSQLSTTPPAQSDMTLLILLHASFFIIHCPANKKITLYYYAFSPLQDSAQSLHFLSVFSCNLSKDSGSFCGEMNNSHYHRYSRRINLISNRYAVGNRKKHRTRVPHRSDTKRLHTQ